MSTVALLVHPSRAEAVDLARHLAGWLERHGHAPRLTFPDARRCGLDPHGVSDEELTAGTDLALSLGGDGTMLWAVELMAPAGVPVMGVNIGHLGYLTEVEPSAAEDRLEKFLAGDVALEERLLLEVSVERAGHATGPSRLAMNEVVVEKAPLGQIVRLGVRFDGVPWTTYAADGLIVATPTGSTAYAFSARGPIVAPRHRALLLTPVAPHMLFDRTLVLEPDTVVEVEVFGDRSAIVAVDGRPVGELRAGDLVRCRASTTPARLVTFGDHDFHEIVKAKFGLPDR